MKTINLGVSAAVFGVVLAAGSNARALPLPDTSTCSSGAACLKITNTAGVGAALEGQSVGGVGVIAGSQGSGGIGLFADGSGTGSYSVKALSSSSTSYAVYGSATGASSYGVYGTSSQYIGVYGSSANSFGIYGQSGTNGKGLYARITPIGAGVAIYGDNSSIASGAFAGYFTGRVRILGEPQAPQPSFTVVSDARLKKNVEPLTGALDKLLGLRGVTYQWKNPEEHGNQTGIQRGFIAQEVEKVLPDWVGTQDAGLKNLTMRGFEALTVESLRTLKAENDALRARLQTLESKRAVVPAGLDGNGLGIGLAVLGAALIVSRRRPSATSDRRAS